MTEGARRISTAIAGSKRPVITMSNNTQYCAICSPFIIYIYSLPNFNIIDTLTIEESYFTGVSISQTMTNILAISYADQKIRFYDFISHKVMHDFFVLLTKSVVTFDFSQYSSKLYILSNTIGTIVEVDLNTKTLLNHEVYPPALMTQFASTIHDNELLIAASSGSIGYYKKSTKEFKISNFSDEITKILPNPDDDSQFLFVCKNKKWVLITYENEALSIVSQCNNDSIEVQYCCWINSLPGFIASGNNETSIVCIWSLSSGLVSRTIDFKRSQISSLFNLDDSLFVYFYDGSLIRYDISDDVTEDILSSGHRNTIFDACFMPSDPNTLATVDASGEMCLWEVPTLKKRRTVTFSSNSIYSVSFSPGGGYIAFGTKDGYLSIVSQETEAKVFSKKIHEGPIVSISWSETNPEMIGTSSTDSSFSVFNIKKGKNSIIGHTQKPMRKMEISSLDNIIAIGCSDGSLYIRHEGGAYFIIKTHDSPLYDVKWSVFDKDIVATTNDLGEVIVVNIDTKTFISEKGHENAARALMWHKSIKNLLISGGYDGKLIFWDSNDLSIVSTIQAHVSHIYSICSHPKNPNLIATTSRDASVVLWSTDLLDKKSTAKAAIGEINLEEAKIECPIIGAAELTKVLNRVIEGKASYSKTDIIHVHDMHQFSRIILNSMLKEFPLDTSLLKRSKKYQANANEAANIALISGNYKKYCEIMFICGEYDKALAAAPNVSFAFWQELAKARAKLDEDDSMISKIVAGQFDEVISELIEDGDASNALSLSLAKRAHLFSPSSITQSKHREVEIPIRSDFNIEVPPKYYLTGIKCSQSYLSQGKVLLAAAVLISIGDCESAIWQLYLCGEIFWATICAKSLNFKNEKFWFEISKYLAKHKYFDEAFQIASNSGRRRIACMIDPDYPERENLLEKYGLTEYLNEGGSFHLRGVYRAKRLLMMGKAQDAAEAIERQAISMIQKSSFDFDAFEELIELLEYSSIKSLNTVALSFYSALYRAFWSGFTSIVPKLASCLGNIALLEECPWLSSKSTEISFLSNLCVTKCTSGNIRFRGKSKKIALFQGGKTVKTATGGAEPARVSDDNVSMFCGRVVGRPFYLEDGVSIMSMDEALMWFSITPFSPLDTHERLCPI